MKQTKEEKLEKNRLLQDKSREERNNPEPYFYTFTMSVLNKLLTN